MISLTDKLSKRYTQAIWDVTETLQEETQTESALASAIEILRNTVACETGLVWLQSDDGKTLTVVACAHHTDLTGISIPSSRSVVGHQTETDTPLVFQHALPEDTPLAGAGDVLGIPISNQLLAPLKTPWGLPFGVIQLINKDSGFDAADIQLSRNLTSIIALDLDDKGIILNPQEKRKPLLELRGVTKEFQNGEEVHQVLRGIDLDIYQNEILVILGESGCGKTTLMNIVGGMDTMTSGSLRLEGKDFSNPTAQEMTAYRKDYIGFIFQSYNLMPNLNALENLEFIAEISANPLDPMTMLTKVGLGEKARSFPFQMSGGQQQRVSIARALVRNPVLILADEPTAALDYETSIEVLTILEEIVRENRKTVMMITHNPEIAKMADRVIRIRSGQIASIRINAHPLSAKDLIW